MPHAPTLVRSHEGFTRDGERSPMRGSQRATTVDLKNVQNHLRINRYHNVMDRSSSYYAHNKFVKTVQDKNKYSNFNKHTTPSGQTHYLQITLSNQYRVGRLKICEITTDAPPT